MPDKPSKSSATKPYRILLVNEHEYATFEEALRVMTGMTIPTGVELRVCRWENTGDADEELEARVVPRDRAPR